MKKTRKFIWMPAVLLAVLLIGLGAVSAGSATTYLDNGAELAVSIDNPVTSTEFMIPEGETTRDIVVSGTASVGLGEPDATFIYVIDVSGSTDVGGGTGCSPILDCEQEFVKALNNAAIADGSVDEVGVAVYASSGASADVSPTGGDQLIIAPNEDGYLDTVVDSTYSDAGGGNGGVAQYTDKPVGQITNFTAGLQAALNVVNASSNGTNLVIFLSDGLSNTGGGGFNDAVTALATAGAVVHSIAVGTGSSCTGGTNGTLQQMADGTGGTCTEVEDPGNLPDIIPDLVSSSLDSLEIEVDGGAPTLISTTPSLPQPGAVLVPYSTTVEDLVAGDHLICVTATGSDSAGTAIVTQCETIHLYQFTLEPATEINELGSDNEHTVTATLVGYHDLGDRLVTFDVIAGPNAGASGVCSPNADCTTDAGGTVMFTYSVPVAPSSLGTDTISASITLVDPMGETATVEVQKDWVDTTPPVPDCPESVNPFGVVPPAGSTTLPGPKGGQNEDGFYELLATDDVWPVEAIEVFVLDTGSGTVFGPFAAGDVIKYTQDATAVPEIKKIGGGRADAVEAHIIGNGDAGVFAVDGSGNVSDPTSCLVPEPPK